MKNEKTEITSYQTTLQCNLLLHFGNALCANCCCTDKKTSCILIILNGLKFFHEKLLTRASSILLEDKLLSPLKPH